MYFRVIHEGKPICLIFSPLGRVPGEHEVEMKREWGYHLETESKKADLMRNRAVHLPQQATKYASRKPGWASFHSRNMQIRYLVLQMDTGFHT